MRCIFCKQNSDSCVSVEHIVPESLGNTEHILPKGWVCDSCNNYIAIKVEKPFLDSMFGRHSRFWMQVPNKKGRIPSALGLHPKSRSKIELIHSKGEGLCVAAADGANESKFIDSLKSNSVGSFYIPVSDLPDADYVTARFIAKIALEVLAHRCSESPGWNDEVVDKPELDELRNYVRIGQPNTIWPLSIRRLPTGFSVC